MRIAVVATSLCLFVVGLASATDAQAMVRQETSIPPQPLDNALRALARDRGFHIVYLPAVVNSLRTQGASGVFTRDEALTQLLSGTGLAFHYLDDDTVTVVPRSGTGGQGGDSASDGAAKGVQKKSFWDRFRLAQVDHGKTAGGGSIAEPDTASGGKLASAVEEIVVTAQKRTERLIDVPQSVSVLSADDLAKLAATQFRDFANTVPGLSFNTLGAGFTQVTLRGVTTGNDSGPTVAIYVDEVPYGSSVAFADVTQSALDTALFDLERIEVLRGPQGTLYGASSMGGLIKYVSKRPDATRFGIDARTGIAGSEDGEISYNGALTVNAPIVTDELALRATGFYSHDGGYIDNLARDQQDVNRSSIYGGRADLLFAPSEAFSLRITGFLQNISLDGRGTADYDFAGAPLDGDLDQLRPFAEPFDQHFRLISGTVTYDLGWAELTSISSYQTLDSDLVRDISRTYVQALAAFGPFGAVGNTQELSTDKFTQEVRLAGSADGPLGWAVGGFYTDERSDKAQEFLLRDPAGQPLPNTLYAFSGPSHYEEYAAFGDLTWQLTDKFDATGGIRYARNRQSYTQFGAGLFIQSRPTVRSSEDVVTYLANARYHFNDHATAYVRYATGYRPGGPNSSANDPVSGLPLGPQTFEADRLKSYEAGVKLETAERRFGIELAAYDVDWSNIQIWATRGGFSFLTNANGGASVQGMELALTARPAPGMRLTGAFAYQDAHLSKADADLGGARGERLPNVPRVTAALNADYDLPIGTWQPTLGTTVRYVSERMASFDNGLVAGNPQYRLPQYTTVDLRAGVTLASVQLQLYVRNIFEERGQLSAFTFNGPQVAILQPRTIGLNVTTNF